MRTSSFAFGTLIALISCLTGVSCQRQKCLGSLYCSGQFGNMKAVCIGGYCYCTGQDYDYNTCLPDAYGCKIVMNSDAALAKPQYNQQSRTTYSCTPVSSSTQYEVHVLGMYEVINRRPPTAGDATVNIVSQGSQTGRLYSCLQAMNLLIGFSIYQLA
ncbi:G-protein coupled receptor Fz Smo [Desmophyllum pertusum]|uniref:G-protein coupled receptor Fz Smo n=1 Tax=Desmophyllum pertusum TaxID=174260 RepID=A0A9W9YQ05_9CNID|nr:G-protein coupled receptor Fz Smo [Desmophyllum pertusum]